MIIRKLIDNNNLTNEKGERKWKDKKWREDLIDLEWLLHLEVWFVLGFLTTSQETKYCIEKE